MAKTNGQLTQSSFRRTSRAARLGCFGETPELPASQLNSTFQIVSLCGGSSTGSWFPTSLQRALTCSKRTCANTPVCGPRFLAACSYEFISATTAARSTPAVGSMKSTCSAITTTKGHCLLSCVHRARARGPADSECCSAAKTEPLRSRPLARKFPYTCPAQMPDADQDRKCETLTRYPRRAFRASQASRDSAAEARLAAR